MMIPNDRRFRHEEESMSTTWKAESLRMEYLESGEWCGQFWSDLSSWKIEERPGRWRLTIWPEKDGRWIAWTRAIHAKEIAPFCDQVIVVNEDQVFPPAPKIPPGLVATFETDRESVTVTVDLHEKDCFPKTIATAVIDKGAITWFKQRDQSRAMVEAMALIEEALPKWEQFVLAMENARESWMLRCTTRA